VFNQQYANKLWQLLSTWQSHMILEWKQGQPTIWEAESSYTMRVGAGSDWLYETCGCIEICTYWLYRGVRCMLSGTNLCLLYINRCIVCCAIKCKYCTAMADALPHTIHYRVGCTILPECYSNKCSKFFHTWNSTNRTNFKTKVIT